ncbi:phospholipase D-like domain-containing protein [Deltaproteobacteria bacterium OttesenSCG-928-M10]|nr:phospholipase D-like domain-containing protein [Deltaproteobacteria bacterium OttesenSCG-928-M10]
MENIAGTFFTLYGLTATPIRQDGHHPIIFQQCGPIRYRVDAKEQSAAIGMIFNQDSFLPVLTHDLEQVRKEIVIVSPYLSKGRINQMGRLFVPGLTRGTDVVIITRPPESFADTTKPRTAALVMELRDMGATVILKERIHQKFAVIDRRVVWYGSINLLSYGKSEESMMRFENREIAEELLIDIEKDIA